MKKEFADIHSLYENLYEDLEQLQEFDQEAANRAKQMAKERIAAGRNTVTGELKSKPKVRKIASVMDMEGYDLIDDTVNFLISEGYVANESDALSIMSEPEFMESFNTGLSEVLNESSENNK